MRKQLWFALILILLVVLSSCTNPNAPAAPAASNDQSSAAATEAPTEAAAEPAKEAAPGVSEFHSAWPYTPPPGGHYNTFVPDSFALGIYQNLMEPSLFMYKWADDTWIPVAGKEWKWKDDKTLEVKLIEGAKWSDGSAFTSK